MSELLQTAGGQKNLLKRLKPVPLSYIGWIDVNLKKRYSNRRIKIKTDITISDTETTKILLAISLESVKLGSCLH